MTLGELADSLNRLEDLTRRRNQLRVPVHFRRGEISDEEYAELEVARTRRLQETNEQIEQIRARRIL